VYLGNVSAQLALLLLLPQVYLAQWKETEVAVKVLVSVEALQASSLELPLSIMNKLQEVGWS
jgi:hypothetical protein